VATIFWEILGEVGVMEFQKRGLPRAHILYILDKEFDLFDIPERIDSSVSGNRHRIYWPASFKHLSS
jgi:hypothetical protein